MEDLSPNKAPLSSAQFKQELRLLQKKIGVAEHALQLEKRKNAHSASEQGDDGEEESWLTTYLDVMTLIVVLFVIMLAYSDRAKSQNTQADTLTQATDVLPQHTGVLPSQDGILNKQHQDLQSKLAHEVGEGIEVIVSEGTISFRISSEILFPSAQAELSLSGLKAIMKLKAVLASSDSLIEVEGHTDSDPIRSARFPSNWELSGARAGSVVRYLESNGIPSNRLRAVGMADTIPLAENNSSENKAKNRRVEIIMKKKASN